MDTKNGNQPQKTESLNYIGNGARDDVRVAMKEVVARWEGRHAETNTQQ